MISKEQALMIRIAKSCLFLGAGIVCAIYGDYTWAIALMIAALV